MRVEDLGVSEELALLLHVAEVGFDPFLDVVAGDLRKTVAAECLGSGPALNPSSRLVRILVRLWFAISRSNR